MTRLCVRQAVNSNNTAVHSQQHRRHSDTAQHSASNTAPAKQRETQPETQPATQPARQNTSANKTTSNSAGNTIASAGETASNTAMHCTETERSMHRAACKITCTQVTPRQHLCRYRGAACSTACGAPPGAPPPRAAAPTGHPPIPVPSLGVFNSLFAPFAIVGAGGAVVPLPRPIATPRPCAPLQLLPAAPLARSPEPGARSRSPEPGARSSAEC